MGDNVDVQAVEQLVKSSDPLSDKIMKLTAKYNAIEDCMQVIKKAFDKDVLSAEEFIKQIRILSTKQCKKLQKLQKIDKFLN